MYSLPGGSEARWPFQRGQRVFFRLFCMNAANSNQLQRGPSKSCPFLPLKAVAVHLELSPIKCVELMDSGGIEFAFDIRRKGSAHGFLVAWRQSVEIAKSGSSGKTYSLADVFGDAFGDAAFIRGVDLAFSMGMASRSHIMHLIEDGILSTDPSRPVGRGPAQSPWISRASIEQFLTARRR